MPPVDRLNPIRAASSESTCNVLEFFREYPDDETCLEYLWRKRFARDGEHAHCERCASERVFKRYETAQKRPCWYCQTCGFRIHPLKGTIFQGSSTSLQMWFYAIWFITSTRVGVSAKQLERELGVTYKTAWRMFNKIRNELMTQDVTELSGAVEVDETFVGGKPRQSHYRIMREQGIEPYSPASRAWHSARKHIVFAMVERQGQVRATVVPDSHGTTLRPIIHEYVLPDSIVYTDEYTGYSLLSREGRYSHRRINHAARVYVMGDVHTQTADGFFALLKNAIRGVHHGVSKKWLQGYCNEYAWRWNRRDNGRSMFRDLIGQAVAV